MDANAILEKHNLIQAGVKIEDMPDRLGLGLEPAIKAAIEEMSGRTDSEENQKVIDGFLDLLTTLIFPLSKHLLGPVLADPSLLGPSLTTLTHFAVAQRIITVAAFHEGERRANLRHLLKDSDLEGESDESIL